MVIRTTANWSWWTRPIRATLAILFIVPFLSGCGLVFVKGPPTGWQGVEDADQLEISAIAQPCTTSKTLVWLDGSAAAFYALGTFSALLVDEGPGAPSGSTGTLVISSIMTAITTASGVRGNRKVNDCRAFNVRLLELRGGGAVGQAAYNWLDEFSPAPDFGVASQNLPAIISPVSGFSPVFRGSISNSPEH